MKYGPNHEKVAQLHERLSGFDWFSAIERPVAEPDSVRTIDFHFMVEKGGFSYKPWGELLAQHETPIERLIFDNGLLDAQVAVLKDFKIGQFISEDRFQDLLDWANDTYAPEGSYYQDTYTYPHELVELPDRLVVWAAAEALVHHLNAELVFFQQFVPWLERGRWPVGWDGEWPGGKLIVW